MTWLSLFLSISSSQFVFFLCPIIMFTLLVGTLLTHLAFSLFSPFFSFHVSSPQVCLSLCLFTLSLLLFFFCWVFFFFEKSHWFDFSLFFQKKLFICSSLFVSVFLFYLLCCFAPFFFNRALSNKINWFFFWQKNHLFHLSKNSFSEFLLYDVSNKSLSSFFVFLGVKYLFSTKILNLLNLAENSPQKLLFQQKMLVQISFSSKHFVFRKNIRFSSFFRFFSSPACVFHRSTKSHSTKLICWKKKKKLLLSPFDFAPFFLKKKLFSIFQLSFKFFVFVFFCISSFSILFLWCLSFFLSFPNKKASQKKKLFR